MSYLDKINSPEDLKDFSIIELELLADEIREFLINSISKTGGHLSSNLGVVDVTIALNYCFDFSQDKIVWDVGHQAYTHKILTGRKKDFKMLRKKDGLSGFPKTSESIYDHFNTGHSSTAISAGLGFVAGRDLNNKNYNIVSVVGDGAMTGGIVYEAMNNAGINNKKMIIILNDNQMSIDENVGSLTNHLNNLRYAPRYIDAKIDVKKFLNKFDICGDALNKILEKTKEGVKHAILPSVMFEQFGIKYIGPIDGHDIKWLIKALNSVKNINRPVLLHIVTKKGYGYKLAEDKPNKFHGIAPFNTLTGEIRNKQAVDTYSDVFSEFMVKEGNKNSKLIAITAAMPSGTGLTLFSKLYKERFFDVGIAEEHAVIFSAGLAMSGFIPVFAVYSTFLQRSYDQIIHDVCLQNLKVIFAIDRAGVVGDDGETHQGVFDLSYLSHIPNLCIIAPKSKTELVNMLDFAVNKHYGPIAIRYPRGSANDDFKEVETSIEFAKSEFLYTSEDKKIIIIGVGSMLENLKVVYELLLKDGIKTTLVNARFIAPIDVSLLNKIKCDYEYVFTVEENLISGGFGQSLLYELNKLEVFDKKVYNLGFPKEYITHATREEILRDYKLDASGLYDFIKSKIKK